MSDPCAFCSDICRTCDYKITKENEKERLRLFDLKYPPEKPEPPKFDPFPYF